MAASPQNGIASITSTLTPAELVLVTDACHGTLAPCRDSAIMGAIHMLGAIKADIAMQTEEAFKIERTWNILESNHDYVAVPRRHDTEDDLCFAIRELNEAFDSSDRMIEVVATALNEAYRLGRLSALPSA